MYVARYVVLQTVFSGCERIAGCRFEMVISWFTEEGLLVAADDPLRLLMTPKQVTSILIGASQFQEFN